MFGINGYVAVYACILIRLREGGMFLAELGVIIKFYHAITSGLHAFKGINKNQEKGRAFFSLSFNYRGLYDGPFILLKRQSMTT